MSNPKILVIDIETSPNLVWAWGLRDQNIGLEQIERPGYILCYAAKWVGEKKVIYDSIFKYKKFKEDPYSDECVAKSAHHLISQADIVVGQNSDNFDLKWLNTSFILNGLSPLPPHKTVDTLKISRNKFRFLSNKLDYVSEKLGFGNKEKHEGFSLWKRCICGDKKAWEKMERYNKKDVLITEKVYLKLRPFSKSHPNMGDYINGEKRVCPACKSSKLHVNQYVIVGRSKYVKYRCYECGHYSRGNKSIEVAKERIISA